MYAWFLPTMIGGSPYYVIAANDAPEPIKSRADVIAPGTHDERVINKAIEDGYTNIFLTEGTFNTGEPLLIADFPIVIDKEAVHITGAGRSTILNVTKGSTTQRTGIQIKADHVTLSNFVISLNDNVGIDYEETHKYLTVFGVGFEGSGTGIKIADVHSINNGEAYVPLIVNSAFQSNSVGIDISTSTDDRLNPIIVNCNFMETDNPIKFYSNSDEYMLWFGYVVDSYFYNPKNPAIDISMTYGLIIDNNYFLEEQADNFINLANYSTVRVSNSQFYNWNTSPDYAIKSDTTSTWHEFIKNDYWTAHWIDNKVNAYYDMLGGM